MGANVFSRLQTQRDSVRMFAQVKGSPFDSVRRRQTHGTALDSPDGEPRLQAICRSMVVVGNCHPSAMTFLSGSLRRVW
jgi:hypothetical protein